MSGVIALAPALRFNGGGHLNHSLFWQILTPNGTSEPTGALAEQIKRDFGSYANMVQQLSDVSLAVQGVNQFFCFFFKFCFYNFINLSQPFSLAGAG